MEAAHRCERLNLAVKLVSAKVQGYQTGPPRKVRSDVAGVIGDGNGRRVRRRVRRLQAGRRRGPVAGKKVARQRVARKDRLVVPRANAPQAPSDRSALLRRCAAVAAVVGGAGWTVKAAVTLATGDEPALAFAVGSALFPFTLLGLWSLVRRVDGRSARIGGLLAATAAVSVVLGLRVRAVGGSAVEGSEDEVTVLTPFVAIAGLGTFAALLALGVAERVRWPRAMPLCLGDGSCRDPIC